MYLRGTVVDSRESISLVSPAPRGYRLLLPQRHASLIQVRLSPSKRSLEGRQFAGTEIISRFRRKAKWWNERVAGEKNLEDTRKCVPECFTSTRSDYMLDSEPVCHCF